VKEGSLEERVAGIEGILEQMDKRLNHIESELRDLRRDLNNRFLWILGVLILKLSKPRLSRRGRVSHTALER
jgi:hypothetical protein